MNIVFPKIIKYGANGRNGWFHATGVDILKLNDQVALSNLNSRGYVGRHQLALPLDAKVLRQVANELNRIADTI